jgi:hypothetical protein
MGGWKRGVTGRLRESPGTPTKAKGKVCAVWGLVESVREINGQRSVERRYYLSSLPTDVQRFAKAVRGH